VAKTKGKSPKVAVDLASKAVAFSIPQPMSRPVAPVAPPPPVKGAKGQKGKAGKGKAAKVVKAPPVKKLPKVAVKPAKASRPSLPLPPPPPTPEVEPARDELPAPRDIVRLTRYGERFGANKIDVRWLPITLPVTGTSLAVFDPAVPKSFRVFDRPVTGGVFRAMLSIARSDDGKERLAAIVIHCGRPPIARWSVAHYKGQKKPKNADSLPRVPVTSGWVGLIDAGKETKAAPGVAPGNVAVPATAAPLQPIEIPLTDGRKVLAMPCGKGEFAAYWAVDAMDKPICFVLDFDALSLKDWKARPPQ